MRPAQPCANKLCNQIALKNPLLLYPHPSLPKLLSSMDVPPLPILNLKKFSDIVRVTVLFRCACLIYMWVGVMDSHFMLLDLNSFFHDCENSAECVRAWSDSTAWKIKERMSINVNTVLFVSFGKANCLILFLMVKLLVGHKLSFFIWEEVMQCLRSCSPLLRIQVCLGEPGVSSQLPFFSSTALVYAYVTLCTESVD